MTDREVVITHLDDLRLFADVTVHPAVSPDNWDVYSSLCDYIDQIKTEVEILLKEQEPVEPIAIKQEMFDEFYGAVSCCPKCDCMWVMYRENDMHYCPECGQAVKWE